MALKDTINKFFKIWKLRNLGDYVSITLNTTTSKVEFDTSLSGFEFTPPMSEDSAAVTLVNSTPGTVSINCALYKNITIENSADLTIELTSKIAGTYIITVIDSTGSNVITAGTTLNIKTSNSIDDIAASAIDGYYIYTVVVPKNPAYTYYSLESANI